MGDRAYTLEKGGAVGRWHFWLLVVVTFAGGITGGALSGWWLAPSPVKAQKTNVMNAEEFLLLDTSGKARAGLGLDKNGEVGLVLMSRDVCFSMLSPVRAARTPHGKRCVPARRGLGG